MSLRFFVVVGFLCEGGGRESKVRFIFTGVLWVGKRGGGGGIIRHKTVLKKNIF